MSDWHPTGVGEPADEMVVDDIDMIGEVTHPIRGPLYRRLSRPRSAAELAEQMDVPVTRLYHHLNLLEQRGLIRVAATRRVGAVTERRYQIAARSLRLSDESFHQLDKREVAQAMGALFDFAKLALQRSIETGVLDVARATPRDDDALLALNELKLLPAERAEFLARLRALLDEFGAVERSRDELAERDTVPFVVLAAAFLGPD